MWTSPVLTSGHRGSSVLGMPCDVPRRAILECFYGPLWTAEQRRQVLDFAADEGATGYVYGPASDARTGADWRVPYGAEGTDLDALVSHAHERGLTVFWRVSPAAPMDRSKAIDLASEGEVATLIARFEEIVERGFDGVLLAFDDIDVRDARSAAATYGDQPHPVAAAHATIANQVAAALRAPLLVCPTDYWGTAELSYRSVFGATLAPDIPVCWTGPSVTSRTVTAEQARTVAGQYQHPIFLWDNYPVNDWGSDGASMDPDHSAHLRPRRLPLAPLTGREPGVVDAVVGYGCNAALGPLTGFPAMGTALRWASDPQAYQPGVAFDAVLERCAEWMRPEAVRALADAAGSLPIETERSELADAIWSALLSPGQAELATARRVITQLLEATSDLDGEWADEVRPWLTAVAAEGAAALHALTIIEQPGDDRVTGPELVALRDAIREFRTEGMYLVSGALRTLIDHAEGLVGAGTPPSPDGA